MSESQTETASQSAPDATMTLLFVDDEANILSSLKRLFRPFGYRIFTADGGAQGLEILAQESIDLVVSDMRMPEMNGAQFLEKVRQKWPETMRILLTGYAEIGATIAAINKGQIYRYISKPWEDNDITLTIKLALQHKKLEREKLRLEVLTQQQNEELKDLNANLEEKVKARTEEVRQTMMFLELAHEKLKKSFMTSVRVFSNLIEMRDASMVGHSRRVADLSRTIAQRMGMSNAAVQDVFVAALLLDVGKIGLSDGLLNKTFSSLNKWDRDEFIKYPIKGQLALMALDQLQGSAQLIRNHRERFDGTGFPDQLAGLAIPLGARILALTKDYDACQIETFVKKGLQQAAAVLYIQEGSGKRYDPTIVAAFLNVISSIATPAQTKPELALRRVQLKPGMVLSRDLITKESYLLLAKDYILDAHLIGQIANFERLGDQLLIYVWDKK